MKTYVPNPSSFKSIAFFSFFGVRNLKAVEGLFLFFPTKILFVTFLSDGKKLIELFLVDILINVGKKIATF